MPKIGESFLLRVTVRNLYRFCCHIATLIHPRRYLTARQYQDSMDENLGVKGTFWWMYKYYYKQIELPEPGKGILEHFAAQRLDFSPPPDFTPETEASLAAGGDILVSRYISGDNTHHLFDDVEDFFFDADIVCANLESPVAPSQPFSPFPLNLLNPLRLNNSEAVFDACFREGQGVHRTPGINFFSTANNHSLDREEAGLLETLDFLDRKGAGHTGTARSFAERDDSPVVEKQGIRIAFLSYTYGLNGIPIPEGKEYLLNLVRLNRSSGDLSLIEEQVRIAKQEKRADIIVACLHWGQEFESYPTQQYIDRGHRLLEMGIDIIVGNHAHGLQPAEQYPFTDPYTGQQKQGLILYALGDLLSWHPALNTRLGGLAKIRLQKGRVSGKPITIISGVEMKPTYLYGAIRREQCSDYRVMDLEALAAQAEAGTAPVALSRKQRSEVLRLRDLAAKVLRTNQLFKP